MDKNGEIVRRQWGQIAFDGDPLYGYDLRLGRNVTVLTSRFHEIRAMNQAQVWEQARAYTDKLLVQIS